MKRILVEWFHCESKSPARSGPAQNPEMIRRTIEAMRPFMRTMQVQLDFREVAVTGDETQPADTIKINGREIEELIGAAPEKTHCGGRVERAAGEMLVDAILKESARFARCGCGCSPEDLLR